MRSLPMIFRMAEEMSKMAFSRTPFYDDFWHLARMPSVQFPRLQINSEYLPKIGKDGFQVSLNVSQFKPSELTVKVVDNNVVVEGKYEERKDEHGFSSTQFVRSFALPHGYKADNAMSTLSSDGVLTVSVPKPPELADKANERMIPIQQTGPAALNVKENPAEDTTTKDK